MNIKLLLRQQYLYLSFRFFLNMQISIAKHKMIGSENTNGNKEDLLGTYYVAEMSQKQITV